MLHERVHGETRKMSQILDLDTQQVVHVSGRRIAGRHFRPLLYRAREFFNRSMVSPGMLLQAYFDISRQAKADFFRIDKRDVTFDDALLLEAAHAAQAGTGREGDPVGQLLIVHPAITLQFGKDAPVGTIQCDFSHILPNKN